MDDRSKVLAFINEQSLAVLSTLNNENKPNSAVIGFALNDEFEFIFGTYNDSRKYTNLLQNKNVAAVIGWSQNITVQYEGIAEELSDEELVKYKDFFFTKNPNAKKYDGNPKEVHFKVIPKWLRYTDLKFKPWEIIELNF